MNDITFNWIIQGNLLNSRLANVKSRMQAARKNADLLQLDKDILDTMDTIIADVIHVQAELKKEVKARASEDDRTAIREAILDD